MTRTLRILLVMAISLMVIAAGGLAAVMLIPPPQPQTTIARTGAIGGPFSLIASDGRTVTNESYRGKWMLIYFGYTSCPDACPTALNNMGVALDRLGPEAAKLQPIFITVDPKRDTQEALAEYLKSFDPRIVALTGTEEQLADIIKEYHLYVSPQPASDGNYLVNHSSYFYLMSPDGKFVNVLHGDLSGEDMAARLRELMNTRA